MPQHSANMTPSVLFRLFTQLIDSHFVIQWFALNPFHSCLLQTPEKESEKSAGKLLLFQEPVLRNYFLITTLGW